MRKTITALVLLAVGANAMDKMHVYQNDGSHTVYRIGTIDSIKFSEAGFDDPFDNDMNETWWSLVPDQIPGTVSEGLLTLQGHERGTTDPVTEGFRMVDTSFISLSEGDYTIEARVKMTGNQTDFGRYGLLAIVFRSHSDNPSEWLSGSYQFGWDGNGNTNKWILQQRGTGDGGGYSNVKPFSDVAPIEYDNWFRMRVVAQAGTIQCYVDLEDGEGWQQVFEHNIDDDSDPLYKGTVGIWSGWNYTPQKQYVDYFRVELN